LLSFFEKNYPIHVKFIGLADNHFIVCGGLRHLVERLTVFFSVLRNSHRIINLRISYVFLPGGFGDPWEGELVISL